MPRRLRPIPPSKRSKRPTQFKPKWKCTFRRRPKRTQHRFTRPPQKTPYPRQKNHQRLRTRAPRKTYTRGSWVSKQTLSPYPQRRWKGHPSTTTTKTSNQSHTRMRETILTHRQACTSTNHQQTSFTTITIRQLKRPLRKEHHQTKTYTMPRKQGKTQTQRTPNCTQKGKPIYKQPKQTTPPCTEHNQPRWLQCTPTQKGKPRRNITPIQRT